LRDLFDDRTDKTMFVMAAGSLRYGDIVEVIDAAKGAGVTRVGIVTDRMRGIAR
jgi:biopolymer transport protein ExbD